MTERGHAMTVDGYGAMRASDADRERVQDQLQTAVADGRLTLDEFGARLDTLNRSRTYDQLAALTGDLAPIPAQPGYGPAAGTNQMAIVSLAFGVSQIFFWVLSGIPAIVLGHIARAQIRRTGEEGAGLATLGIVLGYIGLGLFAVSAFVFIVLLRWVVK